MSERKPRTLKQIEHMARLHAARREKKEQAKEQAVVEKQAEQTDKERWQDRLADFQVAQASTPRDDLAGDMRNNPELRKPTPTAEMEELKAARRGEDLTPKTDRDAVPDELRTTQSRMESGIRTIDHSREVALRTEKLRQEEWRKALEEDEKRRGPNPYKNPRLPMMPASQHFRMPDISEVPDDACVPKGHAPKWVGMRDTLASGKDSMAQVRMHQAFGYGIVHDNKGRPVVTELGVLMSASYDDAAARENFLRPRGSMTTGDSVDRLHSVADTVNRRAGRHLVDITQLPVHSRRVSDRLDDG